jgi:hypothetical protein
MPLRGQCVTGVRGRSHRPIITGRACPRHLEIATFGRVPHLVG